MIGYITLGTNDLERATKFYDELLAVLGASRFMEHETFISWAISPEGPALFLMKPHDKNAATVGNGTMAALNAKSTDEVDAVYNKAIALGAKDEGAAGTRDGFPGFYIGYFRDPDGNKLAIFNYVAPDS